MAQPMANELVDQCIDNQKDLAVTVAVDSTEKPIEVPVAEQPKPDSDDRIRWLRCTPYLIMHLVPLAVIWVSWSWVAVAVAVCMVALRDFALTGFYHRYFSHRSFKTSRWFQFLWAVIGNMAVQKGPIWWAAHHRHHHLHSDDEHDVHSPVTKSFLFSHMGWFMTDSNFNFSREGAGELRKFPELRFLDRFDFVVPVLFGLGMFFFGWFLEAWPGLHTGRWQMLVWGFVISTLICYHVTYSVNSFAHVFGKRRFKTKDESRNNWLLGLLTLGEGWHNNHHRYQSSVRQGFYWWEIDITYYILVVMSWFGLVWDLTPVPEKVLNEGKKLDQDRRAADKSEGR